jgi:CII-binding regulator of phage lambda lysogenization HflD
MDNKTPGQLKSLQTQLKKLRNKRGEVLTLHNESMTRINEQIIKIEGQIQNLSNGQLIVSEHAFVRYMERKYKVSTEDIYKEIVSPIVQHVKTLGDGAYPNGEGLICIVKNNVVVTVKPSKGNIDENQ